MSPVVTFLAVSFGVAMAIKALLAANAEGEVSSVGAAVGLAVIVEAWAFYAIWVLVA